MIAQGKVKSGGGAPSPRHQDRDRGAASTERQHGELQAGQAGGPRLGVVLVRARHLQGLLVQGTPAMRQQPAEARGHHRVHLPPGQPRTALDAEDSLVGEEVPGERDDQGAGQHDEPAPAHVADYRAHLRESGHVGQADSGGQLEQGG